jgi:hypothetical protein
MNQTQSIPFVVMRGRAKQSPSRTTRSIRQSFETATQTGRVPRFIRTIGLHRAEAKIMLVNLACNNGVGSAVSRVGNPVENVWQFMR